jgi:hypothetical protein
MAINAACKINKVDKVMAEILRFGPFIAGKARQFLCYELCNKSQNQQNQQISLF